MPDDPKQGQYRTADLYFAAFLRLSKVTLLDVVRTGRTAHFIFERLDGLPALKMDYYNRRARVDPLTYTDEIKAMKTLVHR